MAASSGVHSYGATLGYGDATNSFTTLSETVDINFDGLTVNKTKFTHLNSDNATHEYKPGLGDPGSIACTMNYDKTTFNTLVGFYRTVKYWRITAPDGGKLTVQGFIDKLPVNVPEDDRITTAFSIALVAKPTFATS
jgi:hypothetical protein